MESEKIYLGLDMGTNSVGWAVTDSNYHLIRKKGKDMWGVRLFEEANTAAERRTYRVSRRRRQREVSRIGVLRELFSDEINKVDPGFFARLDDSKFHMEERAETNKQPFALFADKNYTDKDYYAQYPTIFHLRKELLESEEPHDVRLLYLALVNMFKHRGHFLNSSLGLETNGSNFQDEYQGLVELASEAGISMPVSVNTSQIEQTLGEQDRSRKQILEDITGEIGITKKEKAVYQIFSLMCGLSVKLIDIFGEEVIGEENKKISLSFRQSNIEEAMDEANRVIGDDNFELILKIKELHDRGLLANIMKGYNYLSQARVDTYNQHQRDLKQLKAVFKKYNQQAYHDMFRIMKEGNYSAYVGSVNSSDKVIRRIGKGRSQEELYDTIKKYLKDFPEDDADVADILNKIEDKGAGMFLPKQLTSANGVIPNQVHAKEMKAILTQAEKYLPFLLEKDETNLTVSEKILQLFSFQIPYYVGPLGQAYKDKKGYNVWAERTEAGKDYTGKIYPWNFEEKIDLKWSAEKFIQRMVRHCTYITGETALPKQSLLYEKFMVLNELNNLKIRGEKISVSLKQDIYKALFMSGKKVTLQKLQKYLIAKGVITENEIDVISGIDGGFHSSLSSVGKFAGILGEAVHYDENREMIENIIFWGTIYGNDKRFIKERITEQYGDVFSEKDLKRILGFKFEGWGNLSKEFLNLEGGSKEDGVIRSLIGALWETNDNLMELLSERYTYLETLNKKVDISEKALSEWVIEDLDNLYLSAPVKRMVWQTMRIMEEVEEILGKAPDRIFVEVTREDGEKGKRTDSRKKKLLDLYKAIKGEERDWKKEIDDKPENVFRSKKLYLYYVQMGRCMYTGEPIDFDQLMNDNLYDIDHIYPRHFKKDDSIENNLVLVRKEKNAHKSDEFPIEPQIRREQHAFWKSLLDKKLITQEKYNRLTRSTPFTEEEKAGFISRQIVETSQGTKAITQIIRQAFPKSEVVFSKAGNVSDFRKKFDLYKVRCVNDFHHANDAYLNIVVGNVYFVKFTINPLHFIREAAKNPKASEYKYNMDKIFDYDVQRNGEVAWIKASDTNSGTIRTVQSVMRKNSPLVTRMCNEYHGGITRKVTIWSAEDAKKGQGYIPVKMSDPRLQDVTKYGGVTAVAVSGYTLVEYKLNSKTIRSLESLPVYLGKSDNISEEQMVDYFTKTIEAEHAGKNVSDVRICRKMIPSDSLIKYNGFYYWLGGKTGKQIVIKNAVQLCFDMKTMGYIKKIEKAVASKYYEERDKNKKIILSKEKNQMVYNQLVDKVTNSLYSKQAGVMSRLIQEGQEKFEKISLEEQCNVLIQIFTNYQANQVADLSLIGGSSQTGKLYLNKKITDAKEFKLISQSVTGIYEAEINLLIV